jgi:hypothetical protein
VSTFWGQAQFVDPDGRTPVHVVAAALKALDAIITTIEVANAVQSGGLTAGLKAGAEALIGSAVPGAKTVSTVAKGIDKAHDALKGSAATINAQKQAGHIPGTPQNINREKQAKPTSTFFNEEVAEKATRITHELGTPVPGRTGVKDFEFGFPIGTGPKGGAQTGVRTHESPKTGEIHGHPVGPEK